jgi:hypothetical protein
MFTLNDLAIKHGTDKGTESFRGLAPKGYTRVYERYLEPLRERQGVKILEIGVQKGASVQMWEEYFPTGDIWGIDIKESCARYATDRISIRIGDQTDRDFLRAVVEEAGPFDVVIDDGGHRMEQHRISLEELWPGLRRGGLYFVEDLHTAYREAFGGGFENEASTIELFKGLIDSVNGRTEAEPVIDDVAEIHFSQRMAVLIRK